MNKEDAEGIPESWDQMLSNRTISKLELSKEETEKMRKLCGLHEGLPCLFSTTGIGFRVPRS